jgi:dimethylamine/trimethylamine dehydrogenase
MGYRYPSAEAAMRGVKAEGGWAVVSTQECEIHESSDVSPYTEGRLWDDRDIPALARMADAVHEHGALAAIQLVYQGHEVSNRYSREPAIGPMHRPVAIYDPFQARAMDKADIRAFRRWHRDAALRAKRAGFDLIYVYAGHDLTMTMHFLCRRYNQRTDEYGGSLENRVRLLREVIEDTKEAVGDTCAVPLRLAVDELRGEEGITADGEGREIVELLAELPDLWDVNVSDWPNDSLTSRFGEEGNQEPYVAFVKQVTSKPVVGVGRFTSPDAMVSQIKRGVLDLIGAARPSIADPFLPKKIEEGRLEDIRECIGCNICTSGEKTAVPMRCTQNPTMGEEWRKGWHPEVIAPKGSDDQVLIVGAGPAGLECARALGRRGYGVILAEAEEELGGRVAMECRLPGLAAWGRVRDYRLQQLHLMPNVELYPASRLTAENVLEFGFPRVVLATGCRWRKDGVGRQHYRPIPGSEQDHVVAPESVMAWVELTGPIVIYDDDHFYLGGVLAEKLRGREAARRGPRGGDRDTGPPGLAVDREHPGAGPRPTPPGRAGRRDRHPAPARGDRGGPSGTFLPGDRPARDAGRRQRRPADRASARGGALPVAHGRAGGAWRSRDCVGDAHRRLPGAGHDRGGGLCRPPLCPGARRSGRGGRALCS